MKSGMTAVNLLKVLAQTLSALLILALAGCATDASLHRAQRKADLANRQALQDAKRIAALETQMSTMRAQLASSLAKVNSRQQAIASTAAEAQTRSLVAIERTTNLQQALSLALANRAKPHGDPGADSVEQLFSRLVKRARAAALHPYVPASDGTPARLARLDEATYNKIAWRGSLSGWPVDSPFSLAFQPAGYLYTDRVKVHLVEGSRSETLSFGLSDFNFPFGLTGNLRGALPVAGVDFLHTLAPRGPEQEFLSFLGASYFRALGRNQWWGLSARGVAVNTAVPDTQEGFPAFRSFWIIVPPTDAPSLTVLASLDGHSVTGAYRFVITPGVTTQTQVMAVLFLRHHVKRLGLAPLTSMFLQGRASRKRFDLLHPSIHDSDGLQIENGDGEWIWHPLTNPDWLRVTSFPLDNPAGFGLMQRDREFSAYQALGEHYQNRPSAWVTFLGNCGRGKIDLIEIPSNKASNDNVVAFWEPGTQTRPSEPVVLRYNIAWQGSAQTLPPLGWTSRTRIIWPTKDTRVFSVYFTGGELSSLPSWVELQPEVQVGKGGHASNISLVKLPTGGRWRLRFTVQSNTQVRINARIVYRGRPLTEDWNYGV